MKTTIKLTLNPNYNLYRKEDQAYCDSLQVAESFGRQHKHILETINKLNQPTSGLSEDFRTTNFIKSSYKDSRGRKQTKYLLTKDGFVMVVMDFKTAWARRFKEAYIRRFNEMENFITVLSEVKEDFPEFTEAVKLAHPEPRPYHYSNEINMLYSIILGQTVQSFKKQHNIDGGIREHLTTDQMLQFRKLQRMDIGLLLVVPEAGERKRILTEKAVFE